MIVTQLIYDRIVAFKVFQMQKARFIIKINVAYFLIWLAPKSYFIYAKHHYL